MGPFPLGKRPRWRPAAIVGVPVRCVVADDEIDYRPLPGRKGKSAPRERTPAGRAVGPAGEEAIDYRPLRPARPQRRPEKTGRRGASPRRSARSGPFFRRKWFWRAAAVVGLIVLVAVPVVAELIQARSGPTTSLAALQTRLQQNPNDVTTLVELGDYYDYTAQARYTQQDLAGAVDDWARAATYYEQALEQEPANAALRSKAAAVLTSVGNIFFDAAVGQRRTGEISVTLSFLQEAAYYYEQARSHAPQDPALLTDLGTAYLYQGEIAQDRARLGQAIQVWQEALSYSPDKPETLFNLGNGYADLGEMDQAVAMWQRVIAVAPGSSLARQAQEQIDRYSVGP